MKVIKEIGHIYLLDILVPRNIEWEHERGEGVIFNSIFLAWILGVIYMDKPGYAKPASGTFHKMSIKIN